ncbi:hypothetical protein [Lactococcus lactis]|uniref:hypothetical protein n=1 Tax=Lactococcus lactis TaxID=1358 RepID=UPI0022E536EE|nr:hypothetical protein [Lactococcus lactis]
MEEKKRKAVYNSKADKLCNEKNKQYRQYLNKRSATKNFILKLATNEDIKLVNDGLNERINLEEK